MYNCLGLYINDAYFSDVCKECCRKRATCRCDTCGFTLCTNCFAKVSKKFYNNVSILLSNNALLRFFLYSVLSRIFRWHGGKLWSVTLYIEHGMQYKRKLFYLLILINNNYFFGVIKQGIQGLIQGLGEAAHLLFRGIYGSWPWIINLLRDINIGF